MRFDFRRATGFLVVLLWLLRGTNFAADSDRRTVPEITVLVHNSAGISRPVLTQAAFETTRIFREAGIGIAWVDCSNGAVGVVAVCRGVPGPQQFVLHIVPSGKTSSDLVFGLAFLGQDGVGKYSDVFFDRLEQAHHEFGANLSQLLGTVAAHELGHLLLGSHAHSCAGIMTPVWKGNIFRQINMGNLLFTSEQASLMKERIHGDVIVTASAVASAGR